MFNIPNIIKTGTAVAAALFLLSPSPQAAVQVHDASADFSLSANPTPQGWQYSESVSNGSGPVGAVTLNSWNQGDFGPGQPGWLGNLVGGHAGWAKRIANFPHDPPVRGDDYDWPVGTLMTHGPTSLAWTVPSGDPNRYATLTGGMWNVRKFNRSGPWSLYKNNTLLTTGTVSDAVGTSSEPLSFDSGSGGPDVLKGIPYEPGDTFRFETQEADFLAVNFTVTTTDIGTDPDIPVPPTSKTIAVGSPLTLTVAASGTQPLSYQWQKNDEPIATATGSTLTIPNAQETDSGRYRVLISNSKGTKLSAVAFVSVERVNTSNVHDVSEDFNLSSNPNLSGWTYGVAVASGAGPVGPVTENFNQGDFGAGQPGWIGTNPGPHAGWGKRIDNCPNSSPGCNLPYDAPAGTIFTHGPTTASWTVPANDPNRYATLSGGVWNLRPFNRSGPWRLYKNNTVITSGTMTDAGGNSGTPISFETGTGGAEALKLIPYVPGDSFRVEVGNNDFAGVRFIVTTTNEGPDPDIATQPVGGLLAAGGNINLSVNAVGTGPFTYQWQRNGEAVPTATSSALALNSVDADDTGVYTVVVTNAKGSKTSKGAVVVVDAVSPATPGVHDLAGDFTFMGNPSSRGWTYGEALVAGGGPVGPLSTDWNAATFGPNQPGYVGVKVGAFGGWAERVNNGTLDAFDAPVGTIITHGPTSVKYAIQANEPFKFANLTASLWSVERNNRGQGWKIWKNDKTLLAEGVVSGGTSEAPQALVSANLEGIPIAPGDSFRLEILPTSGPGGQTQGPYGDFVGVNFTINTKNEGPDPAIKTHPLAQVAVEGSAVTFSVEAIGSGTLRYQWQLEGADLPNQTGPSLALQNLALNQGGRYAVVVSNANGSATSIPALLSVTPRPLEAHGTRYDLGGDFSLSENPTSKGWEYANSLAIGGALVGPVSQNWNQPDFGAGQPGWLGNLAGAHAGWAKRVAKAPSGAPGDNYDWPVGTLLTHGPTSVKWTAPADVRPGSVADISGGVWNVRQLNRSSQWRLYRNDGEIMTEGVVDDRAGSSAVPISFATGSGGPAALKNIPVNPGDSFRLDISGLPAGGAYDFVAANFTIVVRQVYDAAAQFDSSANPSPSGWQYSESVANGGGPVGAFTQNWNQPDFGAGQPGWLGGLAGGHAGWAVRTDNGNATPTFDDPVGTLMTHGPTSVRWKAPVDDPGGLASISGGVWNLRQLNRSGPWNVYKNNTLLSTGTVNDTAGTSATPFSLSRGSGGVAAITDIPYRAADEFRIEILNGDFTGVKFKIETYASGIIDPEITAQPADITVVAGNPLTLSVAAAGSNPLTYQWKFNGNNITGNASSATASLQLDAAQGGSAGEYTVTVTSPNGSVTSRKAVVSVIPLPPGGVRLQENGGDGSLVIEAEHFNANTPAGGTEWVLVTDPTGFSGSGAMQANPNSGRNVNIDISASPRLDYKVRFRQAGTYNIYLRGLADSAPGGSANDSINVGLDGSIQAASDRITGWAEGAGYVWSNTTLDNAPATIVVATPGIHILNVWMREDGMILDKIVITSSNTAPAGNGPAESSVEGSARPQMSITRTGNNVTITWTGSGTLQFANDIAGTWTPVQTTGNTHTVNLAEAASRFFRVKQ